MAKINNTFLFKLILKNQRIIKFLIVGMSGLIVNIGSLYILKEFCKLHYLLAGFMAIELSIINNFLLNSFWTWKDRKVVSLKIFLFRLIKFNISTGLTTLFINLFVLWVLTEFLHIYYLFSQLIGIILGTIINYLIYYYWVFK